MNSFAVITLALLALLPFCLTSPIPEPVVRLCKAEEPNLVECWKKCAENITVYILNGVPSRNIPPISSVYIPKHDVKGPTFSIVLTNLKFDGVSTYEFRDLIPDPATNSAVVNTNIRSLKLEGDVTSKGDLDGISLEGTGKIAIDFENVAVNGKLQWESFTVNEVKYHNVFGEIGVENYGAVELKKFDLIKDDEKLKSLKKKLHEAETASYLRAIVDSYLKHLLLYTLRAYNGISVLD